jgi:hypothetical protein
VRPVAEAATVRYPGQGIDGRDVALQRFGALLGERHQQEHQRKRIEQRRKDKE